MSGKGRLQFDCASDVLTGEAARVSPDQRRSVAGAYGRPGVFAICNYQMGTARRAETTPLPADGYTLVMAAVTAAQPQETVGQVAARQEGTELVLRELRQVGSER
jgi:hypothetical protein